VPLDPSYAGRIYPPTEPYRVSREKIRDFASAIGATDPAYHDPAAARALGYPDVVAPPTFPIMIADIAGKQVITDPGLGMDYSRVVHGEQRFHYYRPVVAGDELSCVISIDEITSRAGHGFLVNRIDLSTPEGELVVSVWVRLVVRGED
jgi:acyl dehydratase